VTLSSSTRHHGLLAQQGIKTFIPLGSDFQ
jgi:hypothetical protein